MQYITWLIPSVEQMSDVQMCMGMLLLLEVRVVGEVSLLLYLCLCADGCFCMCGGRLRVFPYHVYVLLCVYVFVCLYFPACKAYREIHGDQVISIPLVPGKSVFI